MECPSQDVQSGRKRSQHSGKSLKDLKRFVLVTFNFPFQTGDWVRRDSGVGAGIDSYYEYVAKAYVLLGEDKYFDRLVTLLQVFFSAFTKKLKAKKTQTQGKWIKNSRIFSLKTQEIGNFKVNCRQNL